MKNSEIATANFTVANTHELFDLSMLEEIGDTKYLLEVLATLMKEMPEDIREMQQALHAGNIDVVCRQAHKIKSSSGIIQAEKLTAIMEDIEVLGKKGATVNQLLCFIDNAAQEYSSIEIGLKIYAKELS